MIEESIQSYVKATLLAWDYDETVVQVRESFPSVDERSQELAVTQLAIGFNFDNGGRPMELGSDLTMFVHTIELWVFGTDPDTGRNVANTVRRILYSEERLVPLLDISQAGDPVIDQLIVETAAVQRQISRDPRPWDRFVWTCTAKVEDTYYPSLL
jgi:hypothetical protein